MINVDTVSKALFDQISDYQEIKNIEGAQLCHGEFVNVDPNYTPWIGVFRDKARLTPRTLGHTGTKWQADITLKVVVQSFSMQSGADAQNLLDGYLKSVNAAILDDLTFGGAVNITTSLDIEYNYSQEIEESFYYQSALITIECQGLASV